MRIEEQSVTLLASTPDMLDVIEEAGRTCYATQSKGSPSLFIKGLVKRGHHSVLEHGSITVRLVTDRAVMAELTRHRLAAYSISSQRYINHAKDSEGAVFIKPWWVKDMNHGLSARWYESMEFADTMYRGMIRDGALPEQARSVLPNSAKVVITMTANIREWRHVISLRTSKQAYPQIRDLIGMVMDEFVKLWPCLFEDLEHGGEDGKM